MTELEKLKHLLEHWIEHNEAHVKTYHEWAVRLDRFRPAEEGELSGAEKADAIKIKELSEILRQIAGESRNLETLFKKAQGIL